MAIIVHLSRRKAWQGVLFYFLGSITPLTFCWEGCLTIIISGLVLQTEGWSMSGGYNGPPDMQIRLNAFL